MTTTFAASSAHAIGGDRSLGDEDMAFMVSDRSLGSPSAASSTRSLSGAISSKVLEEQDLSSAWNLPPCEEHKTLHTEKSMQRMAEHAKLYARSQEKAKHKERTFSLTRVHDPDYGQRVINELGWNSGCIPILEPNGKYVQRWDMLLALCLLFSAIYTPYEIGFLSSEATRYPRPSFWANRTVDLVFVIDIILQFFLPYIDTRNGIYVRNREMIAKKYLRSWFWIDLVSVLPIDVAENASGAAVFGNLQALRLLKLLKLSRLFRVLRSNRLISRYETAVAFNYALWTMFKFVFGSILVSHWMACCWGLIEAVAGKNTWTWTDAYELTRIDARTGKSNFQPNVVTHRYIAALYFAVYTLTSLGYGDVSPANFEESLLSIFLIVSASFYWAYTIGNFCAVVSTMDVYGVRWRQTMDEINAMMEDRMFPHYLRRRVRLYMRNSRHLQRVSHYAQLERHMTLKLRGDMALANHSNWIGKVWYLDGASKSFVAEISQHMHTLACAPLEYMDIPNSLFALQRGIAARHGRPMRKGQVWGLDFVLRGDHAVYIDRTAACALTFCESIWLPQASLYKILDEDGFEKEEIRINKACSFYKIKALLMIMGQRYQAACLRLHLDTGKKRGASKDIFTHIDDSDNISTTSNTTKNLDDGNTTDNDTVNTHTSTRSSRLRNLTKKISTRHIMAPLPEPIRSGRFGAAAAPRQEETLSERDALNRIYFKTDARTRSPRTRATHTRMPSSDDTATLAMLLTHIQRIEQQLAVLTARETPRQNRSASAPSWWDSATAYTDPISQKPNVPATIDLTRRMVAHEESKERIEYDDNNEGITLISIQSPRAHQFQGEPVARDIADSDDEDEDRDPTTASNTLMNEFGTSLSRCSAPLP